MPVKASYLALLGAGAVIAYSGIKGKGIGSAFRATISGQSPSSADSANLINPVGSYYTTFPGSISVGGYVNPFSRVRNLSANRVDQGVDFGGTGPILAIGSGRITSIYNPGWLPGAAFICIRLSNGAYKGKYVYFAEKIRPTVMIGQKVNAGDVIGIMQGSIECGWALPPGLGFSMALMSGQWNGTNSTAYGSSFNNWLRSLGAPSGIIHAPIRGTVLPGYPPSGATVGPGPRPA